MRIIGHRGARGEAPENTLGGFQHLKDLGITAVEFDVRQLQDSQLVVIHDNDFLRTSGQSACVENCNVEQLHLYDHRKHWVDWPKAEYTPMLDQVLMLLNNFDHIEVEIKAVANQQAAEKMVLSLEEVLAQYKQQIVITTFDTKILTALQQTKSQFKKGLLIENDIKAQAIEQAIQYECSQIGWMNQLATQDMIQLSHQAHLAVSVWTVNEVDRALELRDQGIEGLITDIPQTMKQYLK